AGLFLSFGHDQISDQGRGQDAGHFCFLLDQVDCLAPAAGKGWRAVNTDTGAVSQTLENAFRLHRGEPGRPAAYAELDRATILVLGTGGAARAALRAAARAGASLLVAGRRLEAATALAEEFGGQAVAWNDVATVEYDALVNCTPVGSMANEGESPIPVDVLRPKTVVLDAVYRPLRTPLLEAAQGSGCTAVPGAEWFVRQAQEQFQQMIGQPADAELMRAAFDHALNEVVPED
ncbi:MAG: NAD(P)-binding domain-containing protein, partial [Planctomycetota bacterium]